MAVGYKFEIGEYVWAKEASDAGPWRGRLGRIVRIEEKMNVVFVQFAGGKPRQFSMDGVKPYYEDRM